MKLPAFDALGEGSTAVLLLHGIGGGRAIWQGADGQGGTWRALAEAGFRALSLDLPGYGDAAALGPPRAGARAVLCAFGRSSGVSR